ncbi:MAG: hypothetical protein Kow0013_14870 [Pararhodobacter sp.]
MTGFGLVLWGGVLVTVTGVIGLVASGVYAWKLRQAAANDMELRLALQRGVARNLAALFVSVLGLMMVIVGIALR